MKRAGNVWAFPKTRWGTIVQSNDCAFDIGGGTKCIITSHSAPYPAGEVRGHRAICEVQCALAEVRDSATKTTRAGFLGAIDDVTVKCAVGNIDGTVTAADGATLTKSTVTVESAAGDGEDAAFIGNGTAPISAVITGERAVCDGNEAGLVIDGAARGRDSEVFPSSLIKLKSAIRHIHRSGSGIKNSPATPSGSGITVEEAVGDVHGSGINILDTTSILITGSSAEIDRNSRDVDRT